MAFGRRKEPKFARSLRHDEDDFEEEEELEDNDSDDGGNRRTKSFKNKDFRDLNPGDKKKRKEPPKPWGKKERLLVLALILITAGISAFLALSSRGWSFPRFTVPSFSMTNIFKEEIIVIPKQ